MGLNLDYINGQTPLDEDEKEGLLNNTISTRSELDQFEQLNIEEAKVWLLKTKLSIKEILSEDFIKELHFKMFGNVWKWAGKFRNSNKNIGVDKFEIPIHLKNLIDDTNYWIERKSFPADEITIRFSHRLVFIHLFPNGNGRHSRLIADILISKGFGNEEFSWGNSNLIAKSKARSNYLSALKKADEGDYKELIHFSRF
jgi:Fic-DOC domain mobile mystery protein B